MRAQCNVPPKLLKIVAKGIAPSLTRLYNNCIEQSQWPHKWKMGEWTPVFKKGDRQADKNYRPITSLITVDKIFEHLLSKQITEHSTQLNSTHPTLYYRMTAYRKKHSCETTLLRLVEDWKMAIERKDLVSILSIDMSKAFDSLCHSLVIKKLEAYGFGCGSLNLMRSFFDQRVNRVKLNGVTSEWKEMTRGCPQGSSFGPLLCNLFQNDMSFHVRNADLNMYADDHQLCITGKNIEAVEKGLRTEGQLASLWYRNNYLLANPDKFQVLTVNPRDQGAAAAEGGVALCIDGQDITKTAEIKLLGVHIDELLTFNRHISEVCKKI